MSANYKQQVVELLKALETGDPKAFSYIDPTKYIQHNLDVAEGAAGVAALAKSLPPGTKVNTIRVFQDGEFVFTHTEYNFFGPKIGFDIFRFEEGRIVEHWDNLQEIASQPSPSGHSMIDGLTTATELDRTEANKALMQRYMDDLLNGRRESFPSYFNGIQYIQHNPWVADTIPGLIAGLQALAAKGQAVVYKSVHKILGEGNFVLVAAEATFGGVPTGHFTTSIGSKTAKLPSIGTPFKPSHLEPTGRTRMESSSLLSQIIIRRTRKLVGRASELTPMIFSSAKSCAQTCFKRVS